jgi:hypothetical protein
MGNENRPLQPLSAEEFSRLTSQERIEYLARAIEDSERRLKALGRTTAPEPATAQPSASRTTGAQNT